MIIIHSRSFFAPLSQPPSSLFFFLHLHSPKTLFFPRCLLGLGLGFYSILLNLSSFFHPSQDLLCRNLLSEPLHSRSRSMDVRKRGRPEHGFNTNGGFKKSRQEMQSLSTGVGSKSKPCTKFFSTSGCPFGETCHFLHYVPGGFNAVAQMMNLSPAAPPAPRNVAAPPHAHAPNGSTPSAVKSRICNRFNTAEGCKFGDKCHFAHGEWELGKPVALSFDDHRHGGPPSVGRMGGHRMEPPPGPTTSFGATATAKISVEASMAGAIIGKGGVNSKQICRQTGAKLSIRDHESDQNLRNIELEGTFEQIKDASNMVKDLLLTLQMSAPPKTNQGPPGAPGHHHGNHGSNFKTKLCENFTKGSCTFGERCHFAHGAAEMRK